MANHPVGLCLRHSDIYAVHHLLSKKRLVKQEIFFKKGVLLKLKKGHFLLISTLILLLSQDPLAQAKPKNEFSIIYTNDVMGEVEPCG